MNWTQVFWLMLSECQFDFPFHVSSQRSFLLSSLSPPRCVVLLHQNHGPGPFTDKDTNRTLAYNTKKSLTRSSTIVDVVHNFSLKERNVLHPTHLSSSLSSAGDQNDTSPVIIADSVLSPNGIVIHHGSNTAREGRCTRTEN